MVIYVWNLHCTGYSADLVSAQKMRRLTDTHLCCRHIDLFCPVSLCVCICMSVSLTHTHTHKPTHRYQLPQCLSAHLHEEYFKDLSMCRIRTSSGGIIQTNAIYSILVSLTPDPGPWAAYPWQPCVKSGCAHCSHLRQLAKGCTTQSGLFTEN